MDTTKCTRLPNPRETANILSVSIWCWTIGMFKKGYKKTFRSEDLFEPLRTDKSKVLGDRLEKKWNTEVHRANKCSHSPNLHRTIFRVFIFEYFILGCIHVLVEFVLRLGTPILLGELLQYFRQDSPTTYEKALIYASSMIVTTGINAIAVHQATFCALHIGSRIRIAVCSLVYRKALRLSKTSLGETAPGKIVNLVASDVNRFDTVSVLVHYMWTSPLVALAIAYFLYSQVGYAGLIGICPVFLVVFIQVYLSKLTSVFRLQTAIKTDHRVRLMDEIVSGVQVIKLYAWEKPFCNLIQLARRLELNVVKKSSYIRGIYMMFTLFTPRIALYSTLISMLLLGENLTADKVFVITSYFNMLAFTISGMFIRGFAEIAECMVAVRRLQNFLMLEELQKSNVINNLLNLKSNKISDNIVKNNSTQKNVTQNFRFIDEDDCYDELRDNESAASKEENNDIPDTSHVKHAIKLENVTTKWNMQSSDAVFEDIDLNIEKGKLYIVIGTVGSGKSSLLSTILGETNIVKGRVEINGNISYADQDSWIFGSTVRQNILFGQEFDQQRYERVVKACALLQDFKQFPEGDETIVGERGSSLSGGQKARINLARSVYRQVDIYLLDDPLSAVDAAVGKHLFEKCLLKYLENKTRILATHQLQYLKGADVIILLKEGKIYQFSNYLELLHVHPEYSYLLSNEESEDNKNLSKTEFNTQRQLSHSSSITSHIIIANQITETNKETKKRHAKPEVDFDNKKSEKNENNNLLLEYFKIGSSALFAFILLFLFLLTQTMASLTDLFVPILITAEESRNYYKDHEVNSSNLIENKSDAIINKDKILPVNYYIYIYTAMVSSIFFVGVARSLSFYSFCIRCGQRLHDLAFGSLIRTSMQFFDTNPSGKILNRFSKDMGAIDELLPKSMMDSGQSILIMIGSLIVPCTVNPIFLVPITLIGALFYWFRIVYLKTSRNIKKLEGTLRSPVFTHLNATLNGLSTIRAYKVQNMFIDEFDEFQDAHTASWYMLIVSGSAFGFSLDLCCFLLTTVFVFSFLLLRESGQVGLAITQILAMMGVLQWGMRQSAEVVNQLTAVERVLEYKDLQPEPNLRDKGVVSKIIKKAKEDQFPLNDTPKDWPRHGKIDFENVSMRYAVDKPFILKNLTFTIEPTEKIGIVGRTGAGKSSLIASLFRLANVEGVIKIDGIDTGTIALEDLRSRISIIPKNPVLFSGTLRYNLDPFQEFSDDILWKVLDEVELKDKTLRSDNVLDSQIYDHGTNFSVGQRQLICLARAILRNNRILMLDEAIANVDPHTDLLIQRTIRTRFAQCTVLTVAHRLNTIMDSDKVLVMDKGQFVEFDHPHLLLQNESGQFTSLVKETGPEMYDQLYKIARDIYLTKYENR